MIMKNTCMNIEQILTKSSDGSIRQKSKLAG